MRVVEVISMFQEVDLLEAHLTESQHWADQIYVIESPMTFSGQPKRMYFEENKKRFSRFNVEHLVTPPDVFTAIPSVYPPEEATHWYRERRKNRNKNRQYHWDFIRKSADYAYMNDVDEFVSGLHWPIVQETLDECPLYVSVRTRRFNNWINCLGSSQTQWRITRCDQESFEVRKGTFRKEIRQEAGWHFTNCFSTADQWLKNLGICNHMNVPASEIPTKEEIQVRLAGLRDPFHGGCLQRGIQEIMPKDDLSWLPVWMQVNRHLFPWLHNDMVPGYIVDRSVAKVQHQGSWRLPSL
jgi:beta-1,4-mannosyl-glycoprotein beta-1,4-N-acetylglucosaminyltransferase